MRKWMEQTCRKLSAPRAGGSTQGAGQWKGDLSFQLKRCSVHIVFTVLFEFFMCSMIECVCLGRSMGEICGYTGIQSMPCQKLRRVQLLRSAF